MRLVMAGTTSAQPTEIGACLKPAGKDRLGTFLLVTTPSGEHYACIGKDPFSGGWQYLKPCISYWPGSNGLSPSSCPCSPKCLESAFREVRA
jgi:hypothetical protein